MILAASLTFHFLSFSSQSSLLGQGPSIFLKSVRSANLLFQIKTPFNLSVEPPTDADILSWRVNMPGTAKSVRKTSVERYQIQRSEDVITGSSTHMNSINIDNLIIDEFIESLAQVQIVSIRYTFGVRSSWLVEWMEWCDRRMY